MLDQMKPAMVAAGIPFVELRRDTADRAAPVRSFEADEVPLFLISLKASSRGLNLISADTMEECIVELQELKATLACLALDEDVRALPALVTDDIDNLFGCGVDLLAA